MQNMQKIRKKYAVYVLSDSNVISIAYLEMVNDVNLNKEFNHKCNAPIKKV